MALVITSDGVRKVHKRCDFRNVLSMEQVADIFTRIAKGFEFKPIVLRGESQPAESSNAETLAQHTTGNICSPSAH